MQSDDEEDIEYLREVRTAVLEAWAGLLQAFLPHAGASKAEKEALLGQAAIMAPYLDPMMAVLRKWMGELEELVKDEAMADDDYTMLKNIFAVIGCVHCAATCAGTRSCDYDARNSHGVACHRLRVCCPYCSVPLARSAHFHQLSPCRPLRLPCFLIICCSDAASLIGGANMARYFKRTEPLIAHLAPVCHQYEKDQWDSEHDASGKRRTSIAEYARGKLP